MRHMSHLVRSAPSKVSCFVPPAQMRHVGGCRTCFSTEEGNGRVLRADRRASCYKTEAKPGPRQPNSTSSNLDEDKTSQQQQCASPLPLSSSLFFLRCKPTLPSDSSPARTAMEVLARTSPATATASRLPGGTRSRSHPRRPTPSLFSPTRTVPARLSASAPKRPANASATFRRHHPPSLRNAPEWCAQPRKGFFEGLYFDFVGL
ncbi:hypothetical protein MIND_01315800 [Mycena indigotica]|uniref:Uncharacterized protein n=1 Tax=Mycena indigotica TaxID=2126181 RepID=A0A8H6S132_9AGAR|nr:uncharacterized protein MIND_01315800 [Mycena indigotica]KAF7290751.1 hypothetical protein MIND_01315800 [Mycena indigotica]